MARYEAQVHFECPICAEVVRQTIPIPETNWSGDNADERFVEDEAEIACRHCRSQFLLSIQNSDGRVSATVLDHERVGVDCGDASMLDPDDDPYYDFDIPDHPADNLSHTLTEVRQVLSAADSFWFTSTVHRMAFIQQFAALEAYLSDTLIGQIVERSAVLSKAVTSIDELKSMKLTLSEVLGDPEIVKRAVATQLRDVLYHNFSKVSKIYYATLGFDIFPDARVKGRMFAILPIRHDCVHRNGRDKEGTMRAEVTGGFVSQVDNDMLAMMIWIEGQIRQMIPKPF